MSLSCALPARSAMCAKRPVVSSTMISATVRASDVTGLVHVAQPAIGSVSPRACRNRATPSGYAPARCIPRCSTPSSREAGARSGWFSCRSACYLAAGLPVVVQDTGFSDIIPTGEGLFAFSDLDQAVASVEAIEGNYERHRLAAREVARSHFSSEVVLGDLLNRIGL